MADVIETVCAHCGSVNRLPKEKLAKAGEAHCGRCKKPLIEAAPQSIEAKNFQAFISRSDLPVLVDFWAPWCGPCRTLGPILERAAAHLAPEIRVAKLNIDHAQAIAGQLGVQAVPTLAIFQRGRELARTSGVMPEQALIDWAAAQRGRHSLIQIRV